MDDLTIIGLATVGTALLAWFPLWVAAARDNPERRRRRRLGTPDSRHPDSP